MRKTTLVLIAAAALAAAANPALAHCGGSHGKSYRAAQKQPAANKVAVAKTTKPEAPAPLEATTGMGTEAVVAAGPLADASSFQF